VKKPIAAGAGSGAGTSRNGAGNALFCCECEKYPCRRLKQLDNRYRTKIPYEYA